MTKILDRSILKAFTYTVNNLAVRPASLMHKNRWGRTKSVNVSPSGRTSCKIYMVDTNN